MSHLHAILQLSNNRALRNESEETTLHLVGHWNDKAEEDAYLQYEEGKHLPDIPVSAFLTWSRAVADVSRQVSLG